MKKKNNVKVGKRDRDEKRRLLLNKQNKKENQTNEVNFARPDGSAQFLKTGRDGAAVRTPVPKRMLAIILALVFVLTVIPTAVFVGLKGRAEESASFGPVTMKVRANGANNYTTAVVPAGNIRDNLNDIVFHNDLPNGVEFEKALMIDTTANTETEIASVSAVIAGDNEKTYYSVSANTDTGTLLKDDQELVLVYAAKYQVTKNTSENGTVTTSALHDDDDDYDYVWGGNALRVQAKPNTDYTVSAITYSIDGGASKTATVSNNAATIAANDITGDIDVNVTFSRVSEYTVTEANGYHGGMTNSREANIGHEGADGVVPGGTARFYVYSESNTGGSDFVFNMLSINGVDIDYPTNEGDYTDPQPFKNGTVKVTLVNTDTYLAWKSGDTNIFGGQAKHRSLYYIEVTDVHENLEVSFNFKQKDSQEIIIKGLRGIQETGSMGERRGLSLYFHPFEGGTIDDRWSLFPAGTRNYTFNKSDNNIYQAYYNDFSKNIYDEGLTNISRWLMTSANVYLYRVKPGYNPYSVKNQNVRAVYYDDNGTKTAELSGSDLLAGNSAAGRPEDVIRTAADNIDEQIEDYIEENGADWTESQKNTMREALRTFGSYDSMLRFWGKSSVLENNGDIESRRNFNESSRTPATELALTTIDTIENSDATKRWYAVALEQNESKNQQLYLNADPYNYSLQLETGTASLSASGYLPVSIEGIIGNVFVETTKHTVEDAQKYIVLPSDIPSKGNDFIFRGWQLVDAEGQVIDGYVYQSNEQVPLNETVLAAAFGDSEGDDLTIRLQAVFEEISHASTAKVSATTYYQDPNGSVTLEESEGKTYAQRPTSESVQPVGEETAILNTYEPTPAKYYELSNASHLRGTVVPQETYSVIPQENQLKAIYDLKLYDFTLKKELFGRTKYTSFDISLKLTRPNDYPYTLSDMKNHIITMADSTGVTIEEDTENDALIYTKTFGNQDMISLSGIPYGWGYEVIEAAQEKDDSSTSITATSVSTGKHTSQEGKTFSGTVEEATDIVVTNQKENDDPNIVSDKWLEKEPGGDTYKLTMESYSIGATITETQTDPVPMDIALVVDQSGSMGTQDVDPTYVSAGNKGWTVSEATSGETHYFLAPNGKYYPVQAEEGTLYEKVAQDPYIYQMIGRGHDGLTVGVNGSPVHFNVPTKYYALDSDKKIHKVYVITVGEFAQYAANTYYYTNNNESKPVHTSNSLNGSNILVNETHPYNNAQEWSENIYWAEISLSNLRDLDGLWNSGNLYKTNNEDVYLYYGGTFSSAIGRENKGWHVIGTTYNDTDYVKEALLFNGSHRWRSLAYNGQVCFVGQPDGGIASANNNMMHYSWISNGDPATDLYLPKDGTNYNRLYYVDDSKNKVYLDDAVDVAEATAYNGELYVVRGKKTRVKALEEALTQFVGKMAQNSQETGADHRMAIIGFAGNKFPALSVGETAYNDTTTKYDYTDTGLFLNGTFINYQTITGSTATTNPFINLHYYTTVDGTGKPTGTPVEYRNGKWYYIGTDTQYSGSTFYEPQYSNLTDSDYNAALVEVSENSSVNTKLSNAIENLGYYGGTYTSYGMAMANNVFTNRLYDGTYQDSQGNTKNRQKVIVVFTDGEPGASGYDNSIAGEALAEGNKATDDLDAIVYTIGLYPGNVTQQVTDFMEQLSSKYSIEKKNVYGGTNNGVSESGSGTLDGDSIYYFENPEDNKTYAVTTQKDGLSTLGWWQKTDTGYIRRYPKTSSNDSRTIDGQSVITFYNANGSAEYEENLSPGTVYFTSNSTRNASTAIKYEYRWYDSNGKVRDPIKQDYGTYDTTRNTYQFFKLDRENPVENGDGKQYYYPVKQTKDLLNAFSETFENITTLSSQLDVDHSLIRDVINSDAFSIDAVDNPRFEVQLIPGSQVSENDAIEFDYEHPDNSFPTNNVTFNDNVLTVKKFDFSSNYIAPGHDGYKIRITIHGLKPKDTATGGIFESNTGESGVCKLLEDDNGDVTDEFKLIDAFPKPSISRYKYTIDVDGDDTTATYNSSFVLKDKDGNPLADGATLLEEMKHAKSSNNRTWTDNGQIQNVENKQQKSIIFEEIRDVDQFEVLLEGNQYKHGDSIPDDYQIAATVTGTNMNATNYSFTDKFNDDATEDYTPTSFTKTLLKQDNTIHISSKEERRTVTIQEITKAKDGDPDYSDKNHIFNVKLVLKDASNNPVEYAYDDLEFDSNGELSIPMKHNDAVTFEVPVGYRVEIYVDNQTQGEYERSYKENGTDKAGPNYASGQITDFTSIQVINSLAAPDIASGVLDENNPFGIILAVLASICVLAGGGTFYYTKRKKEEGTE